MTCPVGRGRADKSRLTPHCGFQIDKSLQYAAPLLHHPHFDRQCDLLGHGSPVHTPPALVVVATDTVVLVAATVVVVLTMASEVVIVVDGAAVVAVVVVMEGMSVVVIVTEAPKFDESWKLVVPQTFGFVAWGGHQVSGSSLIHVNFSPDALQASGRAAKSQSSILKDSAFVLYFAFPLGQSQRAPLPAFRV